MNNPTQAVLSFVVQEQKTEAKGKGGKETTVAICVDPRLIEAFLMSIAASNSRSERYLQLQELEEKRKQERHEAEMGKARRQAAVA